LHGDALPIQDDLCQDYADNKQVKKSRLLCSRYYLLKNWLKHFL